MTEHLLGRDPAFLENCSDKLRREICKEVLEGLRLGVSFDNCCWAAECPPEIFTKWRESDPRLHKACMKELALLERELVRKVREGGRGLSEAKAALEVLERTFKSWARKTQQTITKNFEEALVELKKRLPVDQYEIVVEVLSKHS
jgi:hypothetical protein